MKKVEEPCQTNSQHQTIDDEDALIETLKKIRVFKTDIEKIVSTIHDAHPAFSKDFLYGVLWSLWLTGWWKDGEIYVGQKNGLGTGTPFWIAVQETLVYIMNEQGYYLNK